MIDYQKEVARLVSTHPDVVRFFQQARGIDGCDMVLAMMLEQRGRAIQCLRVQHTVDGGVHMPRYHPGVLTRELAAIAGCTHLTNHDAQWLDNMKQKEDER